MSKGWNEETLEVEYYLECCAVWVNPDETWLDEYDGDYFCENHIDDVIAARREEKRMRSTEYRMVWG